MDIWQVSETSYSKSSLGNFHHHYLAELLINYNGTVQLSFDGEMCVLMCVSKAAFLKSGHIWNAKMIWWVYIFVILYSNNLVMSKI